MEASGSAPTFLRLRWSDTLNYLGVIDPFQYFADFNTLSKVLAQWFFWSLLYQAASTPGWKRTVNRRHSLNAPRPRGLFHACLRNSKSLFSASFEIANDHTEKPNGQIRMSLSLQSVRVAEFRTRHPGSEGGKSSRQRLCLKRKECVDLLVFICNLLGVHARTGLPFRQLVIGNILS